MNRIILSAVLLILVGCTAGNYRNYVVQESREGIYKYEIIVPLLGSVSLPGNPDSWKFVGTQAGWHTFKNKENNDIVQYVNGLKNRFSFYNELSNNEIFLMSYYRWEDEYLMNSGIVELTKIIEKEFNEDNEDYILIEVVRNDNIRHFIKFSVQSGRVVAVTLRTDDPGEVALEKIKYIYNSTKKENH